MAPPQHTKQTVLYFFMVRVFCSDAGRTIACAVDGAGLGSDQPCWKLVIFVTAIFTQAFQLKRAFQESF